MDRPIYHQGRQVGTLRAVPDGLYWQLTAFCEPFSGGVQRLYGAEDLRTEPFGVFVPDGKGLHLHRRLSRHGCPDLPELWLAGRETDGWRPWRGTVEGQSVPDAMLRGQGEGCELALPAEGEGLPLAEYVPQMRPLTLEGREYLVLPIPNGVPEAAPEAPEP